VQQNPRRRLLPPSGFAPCGSSIQPPVSSIASLQTGANSVPSRSIACMMIQGGEPERRAPCASLTLGGREGPVLESELAFVAGQHDVGGLIQERSHAPIAAFGDAADVVDLAGLMPRLGTKPR
jgi:hypothetical protein